MFTVDDDKITISISKSDMGEKAKTIGSCIRRALYACFIITLIPILIGIVLLAFNIFGFCFINILDMIFTTFWAFSLGDKMLMLVIVNLMLYHIFCTIELKPFDDNWATGNGIWNIIYTINSIILISLINKAHHMSQVEFDTNCVFAACLIISVIFMLIYNIACILIKMAN